MKKYKIDYYFDGEGSVIIEAKNETEAKEVYFNGNFSDEEEWGENYNIESIEEVK